MPQFVFNGWELPSVKADPPRERFLKLISCPEVTGYDKATILFSHIPAGSGTGLHTHPDSDEIMFFVGRGEGAIGGEKFKLETDSVLVVLKGVEHECRNTSTETLKIYCVYIPPLKLSPMLAELAENTKKHLKK
jgi:mannose-6-phosphate isomerase-like protein (cupin superfamily)